MTRPSTSTAVAATRVACRAAHHAAARACPSRRWTIADLVNALATCDGPAAAALSSAGFEPAATTSASTGDVWGADRDARAVLNEARRIARGMPLTDVHVLRGLHEWVRRHPAAFSAAVNSMVDSAYSYLDC